MKKLTITEMREKEVSKLASRDTKNERSEAIVEARKIMCSFYRLCGLEKRLLELENNEKTCNSRYVASLELKAEKWRKRLQAAFKPYGLMLVWYSYLPTITNHKGGSDVIDTYFYR